MDEKLQIVLKKIAEVVYEQYLKDLKNGNLKNEIFTNKRQSVGKSAKKVKTFQQTALMFNE